MSLLHGLVLLRCPQAAETGLVAAPSCVLYHPSRALQKCVAARGAGLPQRHELAEPRGEAQPRSRQGERNDVSVSSRCCRRRTSRRGSWGGTTCSAIFCSSPSAATWAPTPCRHASHASQQSPRYYGALPGLGLIPTARLHMMGLLCVACAVRAATGHKAQLHRAL